MNTVLLHTKKQQLMSVLADRFYRQEKNTELMVDILGHAVECRSGEGGTHMTHVILVTGLLLQCLAGKTDRYHLEREDIEAIRMASGLHDIGKLQIPEEILTKPHSLTPEEYEIVKRHTQIGAKLITDLPIYQNERLVKYAIEICRWHHERWNGEGYPDGLKGDAIPIAAQVVSVADVYDALSASASKRTGLPKVVVDPAGSADFLAVVGTKTLDEIRGWAETATIDETYFETEAGRYNSLVGIIRDIDKSYPELHISASIGGAFAAGRISRTIRRVDLAMYQAKLKKDCVAIYREAKERET